jgi:hypothetical protein
VSRVAEGDTVFTSGLPGLALGERAPVSRGRSGSAEADGAGESETGERVYRGLASACIRTIAE